MQKKVDDYLAEVEKRRQTTIDLIHYLDALKKKTKYLPEPLIKGDSRLRRFFSFTPICPLCNELIAENRCIHLTIPELDIQWSDYYYWNCTSCDYEKIIGFMGYKSLGEDNKE